MKKIDQILKYMTIGVVILGITCLTTVNAQTDTTKAAKTDTTKAAKPDTAKQQQASGENNQFKKKTSEFITYVGVNFNQLAVSSDQYKSTSKLGYQIGIAYKRGKFFYWQAGARFSYAPYQLGTMGLIADTSDALATSSIDIPITGGINFLRLLNGFFGIRLYVSATPSFTLGVSSNDLGITKDDLNTFIFYGQGGLGFDVWFFKIDAGYNYGFQDLFKNAKSKPGQIFVNLGFRF